MFLDWLSELPPGGASFVGTLTGSSFGLLAILIGAMFNAHLNRKRDDALRDAERQALASALTAELASLHRALTENANDFRNVDINDENEYLVPDLSESVRVLPALLPKLGLLDSDTIQKVIAAYRVVEQYTQALLTKADGHIVDMNTNTRLVHLRARNTRIAVVINEAKAEQIQKAIDALRPYFK